MHDEVIYRACEIIKLLPALESQRGIAPAVELRIRCQALPRGFLLNPGWGHQAAQETQVTLQYTSASPLRTYANVRVGFILSL